MVSSDEIERETSRDRGILSGSDRKWLLMDRDEYVEEHSRQYWGQRRDEVTERIHNAFLDLDLLAEHLEPNLYEEVSPLNYQERVELETTLQGTLRFIMNVLGTRLREELMTGGAFQMSSFWKDAFVPALKQHGIDTGVLVDDVESPEIHGREAPNIGKIIERAEAGEELTGAELELLLQSGRVEKEQIYEAVSEAVRTENQS